MASKNAPLSVPRNAENVSGNAPSQAPRRRGRPPARYRRGWSRSMPPTLPHWATPRCPPRPDARTPPKLRQYLAWLDTADLAGDPLTDPDTRDRAVRDWRSHLLTVAKQAPATVNTALAAVDDFYTHRALGPLKAARTNEPAVPSHERPGSSTSAPNRAGCARSKAQPSTRDRALASIPPFYAGARIAETARLDTGERARLHARKPKPCASMATATGSTRDTPPPPTAHPHPKQWLGGTPGLGRRQHEPGAVPQPPRGATDRARRPRRHRPHRPGRRPPRVRHRPRPPPHLRRHPRTRRHEPGRRRRTPRPHPPGNHPRLHPSTAKDRTKALTLLPTNR